MRDRTLPAVPERNQETKMSQCDDELNQHRDFSHPANSLLKVKPYFP